MLEHLSIKHFRLFEDFFLDGLRQVNLFTGKNNSGKTVLLEAIRIWASQGDTTVINHILLQRGEWVPGWGESYEALFHRDNLSSHLSETDFSLSINEFSIVRHTSENWKPYCESLWNGKRITPNLDASLPADFPRDGAVFLSLGADSQFPLFQLWNKIVLTPEEDEVLEIIRETILPEIVRIDINQTRTLVRVSHEAKPLPLQNFGEGVLRMMLLAVALVSAKGKILLIDEVEAGLHHTTMEMFWKKIFDYAQKHNVQVFATTHSHDAVKAFTYALENTENTTSGTFIRLQKSRKNKSVETVKYSLDDLELSLESNLEPR
ncbi:MAG TPA: AAA family ATPase [Saprospiraceae bacterium]|nr:AAA family ATPase [Saprospiraceae bacterium]HRK81918.1 AAA family ATPase [Saprospiraceae bacterium]